MQRTLNFKYMQKSDVMSEVHVNYDTKEIVVKNYTDINVYRAFGVKLKPTLEDLYYFLESRCFQETRHDCQELLELLGLKHYTPLEIVKKTHGSLYDDYNWVMFEGESLDYEKDIKMRD